MNLGDTGGDCYNNAASSKAAAVAAVAAFHGPSDMRRVGISRLGLLLVGSTA
jgi:hypothetical protein